MDPSHDVSGYDTYREEYYPVRSSWPDITGMSASYDQSVTRVGTSITAYRKLDGYWTARIHTSQGCTYTATWGFNASLGPTEPTLRRARTGAKRFYLVPCDGFTITRTERGMSTRIPTSCIGSPWRIKVGADTFTLGPSYGTPPGGKAIENYDSAFVSGVLSNDRHLPDSYGLGPWMTQG